MRFAKRRRYLNWEKWEAPRAVGTAGGEYGVTRDVTTRMSLRDWKPPQGDAERISC